MLKMLFHRSGLENNQNSSDLKIYISPIKCTKIVKVPLKEAANEQSILQNDILSQKSNIDL